MPSFFKSLSHLLLSLFFISRAYAEVTVYTTEYTGTGLPPGPAATASCLSASACDGAVLTPIANPQTPVNNAPVPVQLTTGNPNGIGHIVNGDFQGFSIELSIANSIRKYSVLPVCDG